MRRGPIGALLINRPFPGSAFSFRAALREAVGLAVHFQDMDVMGQAVEKRACETFFAEGGGPFVERQVRGDDGGAALVTLADQLKQ